MSIGKGDPFQGLPLRGAENDTHFRSSVNRKKVWVSVLLRCDSDWFLMMKLLQANFEAEKKVHHVELCFFAHSFAPLSCPQVSTKAMDGLQEPVVRTPKTEIASAMDQRGLKLNAFWRPFGDHKSGASCACEC